MGCDIHLWCEYKNKKTNKWQLAERTARECEFCHGTGKNPDSDTKASKSTNCYLCDGAGKRTPDFYEGRCYDDFAILADVRNGRGFAGIPTGEGFKPIAKPRGVPKDSTDEYKREVKKWDADGHSHSFFTLRELLDYDWSQTTTQYGQVTQSEYAAWRKQGKKGEPPSYSGGIDGANVKRVSNKEMEKLLDSGKVKVEATKTKRAILLDLDAPTLYVTSVTWHQTYQEAAYNLWHQTIPEMRAFAKEKDLSPDHIRICFFFDN